MYRIKCSNFCVRQYFCHCFLFAALRQSIVLLLLHLSQQTEVVVTTRGGNMWKMIVYFKLMQIVLTLAFIWQLLSLNQFCGTFANPKVFLHHISMGHCKSFTLIGKDTKTGDFGTVFFDHHKWQNQQLRAMSSSTNGRPIDKEQQQHHQFMNELSTKLPHAGRHCIPITITPFDWILDFVPLLDRNPLKKLTFNYFSDQLYIALCSLIILGFGLMSSAYFCALHSVFCWCLCVVYSFKLLLNWTDFWTCANFQADQTNVPMLTLVLSIVMVCSSVFEILFQKFVQDLMTMWLMAYDR